MKKDKIQESEPQMKDFGPTLKRLMKEKRISAMELSKDIGIPLKSIQEWTNNGRFPRDPLAVRRLGEYFHCSIHVLMFGSEDPYAGTVESLVENMSIHTGVYEVSIRRIKGKSA